MNKSNDFRLKHPMIDSSRFSSGGVKAGLEGEIVCGSNLFPKIRDYISKFCVIEEAYIDLITLWIMGTYIFPVFRYYPYLKIQAEKGSGKTTLLEVLAPIAFNGQMFVAPTESVIFRFIENNKATLLFDEVEYLKTENKDVYAAILSILNAGFNSEGVVIRNERIGDKFIPKKYSAYSPKIFCGIDSLDNVLADRAISVKLYRKKDTEVIERYKATEELKKLQKEIRDELYIWALDNASKIAQLYQNGIVEKECIQHLSNRELDIWEPLFIIAYLADDLKEFGLIESLKKLSEESSSSRIYDNICENQTCKLLFAIKMLVEEEKPLKKEGDMLTYKADDVLNYFNNKKLLNTYISSKYRLTSKLKTIDISSKQQRIGDYKGMVYLISKKSLEDLCERYQVLDN
ncbi:MAG: DUF3631 domain-containing protein [bacterium]